MQITYLEIAKEHVEGIANAQHIKYAQNLT